MRIAFVCPEDPEDPAALSGLPYAAKRQLSRFAEVVPVLPAYAQGRGARPTRPAWRRRLSALRGRLSRPEARSALEVREGSLRAAEAWSRELDQRLARDRFDLLFTCAVTTPLYRLGTAIPVVHFSDAVARPLFSSYPVFTFQSEGSKDAWHELESEGIRRLSAGIWPSGLLAESAVRDYGLPPERAHVLPLGANFLPLPGTIRQPAAPPTRENLQISIVASDPVRKRLELAVLAVELLRARGWKAVLTHVGPRHAISERSPATRWAGALGLRAEADHAAFRRVMAETHIQLLPSLAENFGIAPAEAAHFGKPSIVSRACGIAEFIESSQCGVVLPTAGTASEYVTAIEEVVDTPGRYQALSAASLRAASRLFHWDRWGERTWEILTGVVTG